MDSVQPRAHNPPRTQSPASQSCRLRAEYGTWIPTTHNVNQLRCHDSKHGSGKPRQVLSKMSVIVIWTSMRLNLNLKALEDGRHSGSGMHLRVNGRSQRCRSSRFGHGCSERDAVMVWAWIMAGKCATAWRNYGLSGDPLTVAPQKCMPRNT